MSEKVCILIIDPDEDTQDFSLEHSQPKTVSSVLSHPEKKKLEIF